MIMHKENEYREKEEPRGRRKRASGDRQRV